MSIVGADDVSAADEVPLPSRLASILPTDTVEARRRFDELVQSWRFRAASFTRESTLSMYSALIDNTLVVVLEKLKVDRLLRRLQPVLEQTVATVFGKLTLDCSLLLAFYEPVSLCDVTRHQD